MRRDQGGVLRGSNPNTIKRALLSGAVGLVLRAYLPQQAIAEPRIHPTLSPCDICLMLRRQAFVTGAAPRSALP